jgi:hypothetical protein
VVSNQPYSEQFRIIGKRWNEADAEASLLEELKSATLSQMMLKHGDIPVSRAEMLSKASGDWTDYITTMVNCRKAANDLKLQLEHIRMKDREKASDEATRRAEMRL